MVLLAEINTLLKMSGEILYITCHKIPRELLQGTPATIWIESQIK